MSTLSKRAECPGYGEYRVDKVSHAPDFKKSTGWTGGHPGYRRPDPGIYYGYNRL